MSYNLKEIDKLKNELGSEFSNMFALDNLDNAEKKVFVYLWYMTIDFLSTAKANMFQEVNILNSPKRINQLLKENRWYLITPNLRQLAIIYGYSALHYYESKITGDIIINVLSPIIVQYYDNILVKFTGTNMDLYPDTSRVYDYYEYVLNEDKTFTYTKLKYAYIDDRWTLEDNRTKPIKIKYDKLPIMVFANNAKFQSSFKNLNFHIGMFSYYWFKILEDTQLGTNKFLLNLRGMPTGQPFFEMLNKWKKSIKQGSILSDTILQINPNSNNPLDKMFGSLQVDQLMYGMKMTLGFLKEVMFVISSGNGKISAQQNNYEIIQESLIVTNDDLIVKNIWENQYQEFIENLIRFDKNYLKTKYDDNIDEIKVKIKMAETITDIMKEIKKGNTNGQRTKLE